MLAAEDAMNMIVASNTTHSGMNTHVTNEASKTTHSVRNTHVTNEAQQRKVNNSGALSCDALVNLIATKRKS